MIIIDLYCRRGDWFGPQVRKVAHIAIGAPPRV